MTQNDDAAIIAAGADVLRHGASCLSAAADRLGADFTATARALDWRARRTSFHERYKGDEKQRAKRRKHRGDSSHPIAEPV